MMGWTGACANTPQPDHRKPVEGASYDQRNANPTRGRRAMSKPAGERLAAIEAILTRVENKVDRQEQRISNIEVTVTSFKGGWWALGTAGTLVSAITAWVVSASDWFKGS